MEEEKKETEEVKEETKKENFLTKKKQVKGKSLRIWIIVMIIIFMLFTFGLGMYLGKEMARGEIDNNDKPKEQEKKKDPTPQKVEELDVNSTEVQAVMEQFNRITIEKSALFATDKFDISNATDVQLIGTAIKNLSGEYAPNPCGGDSKTVPITHLNEVLKKYINGKTITYDMLTKVKDNFYISDSWYGPDMYSIIDNNNIEVINSFCGAIADGSDFILSKYVKAEKATDGEYIYVYQKNAFGKYSSFTMSPDDKVDYYLTFARNGEAVEKNLADPHISYGDNENLPNSTPNWDKYNTYKYTFKLIDGTYYFQSIELVK